MVGGPLLGPEAGERVPHHRRLQLLDRPPEPADARRRELRRLAELAGQVGTMSAVFPDGVPECRAAGTATFDVEQGTYAFVATCGDKRWEDEVYVSAPFCVGIRLE